MLSSLCLLVLTPYMYTTAGTIFAVYEKADGSIGTIEDVMRAGVDIKVGANRSETFFTERSLQNALYRKVPCRTVLLIQCILRST
jgi:hypothetical protein